MSARGHLEGRAALVTGGGSGIGLACAQKLASDGATVTICGRTESKLQQAVDSLGERGRYVMCDVTDEDQVRAAVEAAAGVTGSLDVVVANAGGGQTAGPLLLTDLDGWNRTLAVNLTGSFLTIKHCAPSMSRGGGGSIVAISSIAGVLTHRHLGAYSVSKAALEMLVRNAADELGQFGVRVNAVRPGLVPTDASGPLVADEVTLADFLVQMPLGRTGKAQEVAEAVRFLAGDESSWVTGQIFAVDGGHTLRRGPDLDHLMGPYFAEPFARIMGPVQSRSG